MCVVVKHIFVKLDILVFKYVGSEELNKFVMLCNICFDVSFKNVLCLSSAVCFVSYYLIPFHERKPRSSIFFLLPNSLYFVLFFLALSMG